MLTFDSAELVVELGLESRADGVEGGAQLVVGHSQALSVRGAVEVKRSNRANPGPTAV
jgi:hypothetical protein